MLKNIILFNLLIPLTLVAQTLTITSPSTDVSVKSGDDFATDVLNNPWDMSQLRDIGWQEHFPDSSNNISSGVWSSNNLSGAPGYIFPLFHGFKNSARTIRLPGDLSLPAYGYDNPIDASKYNYLSMKSRHSRRQLLKFYWNNDLSTYEGWPDNSRFVRAYDGVGPINEDNSNTFRTTLFDLNNFASNYSYESSSGSWTGNIFSLRIDPSHSAINGDSFAIDWIRLVDPSSAPNLTITWNSSSIPGGSHITIYYDEDNSGSNGTPLNTLISDTGTYTFPTAALPPGDYYFYITAHNPNNLSSVYATSGYSARLRINNPPVGYIESPSPLTGLDYAGQSVGNLWDFSDFADVANLYRGLSSQWLQFDSHAINSGEFSAVARTPFSGATTTDAQVHMNINQSYSVDPNKYRYFTYKIKIDETNPDNPAENFYPTLHDKVNDGWVARIIWWITDRFSSTVGSTKPQVLYSGWNTYVLDLQDPSLIENGYKLFNQYKFFDNLRIDPLETRLRTKFSLDYAKLTTEPRPDSSGIYQININLSDLNSDPLTLKIYRDNNNQGYDGTLISDLGTVSGPSINYNFDTTGLPSGSKHYIYIEYSDGIDTRRIYSTAPIAIGPFVENVPPTSLNNPSSIQIIKATKNKKKIKKKGGTVSATIITTADFDISSVKLVAEGKNGKKKKIKLETMASSAGSNTYIANIYFPSTKNKSFAKSYNLKFIVRDGLGSSKEKGIGKVDLK